MTKLCLLLGVCLAYATVVTAQQCANATIKAFFECEEKNFRQGMEEKKVLEKAERQCFEESHCKHFDFEEEMKKLEEEFKREHEHHGSGHHGSGHHGSGHHGSGHHGSGHHERRELTEAEKEAINNTRTCFEEIFKKEYEELSACVEKETGFKLPKGPEHPEHPGHYDHRDHHRRGGEEHDEEEHKELGSAEEQKLKEELIEFMKKVKAVYDAKMAKSCDNNATAEAAVRQCLAKTAQQALGELKTFCTNKKTCFETFTATKPCDKKDIEETVRHVFMAVFKCKKEDGLDGKPNFQKLSAGISQCDKVNFTRLEEHHRRHGGPGGEPHHEGKEGSGHHFSGHHEFSGHHSGHHQFSGHHSGFGSGHPKFPPNKEGEEKREDPIEKLCMALEHPQPATAPKA